MYYLIEYNRKTKETECTEYQRYSEARQVCLQKEQEYPEMQPASPGHPGVQRDALQHRLQSLPRYQG